MQMDSLLLLFVTLVFAAALPASDALDGKGHLLKSATFLSPSFFLRPGSVADKFYYDVPFPRGHIALKSFDAEVVDEDGVPVSLHETYLHHWVVEPYYGARNRAAAGTQHLPEFMFARNSGVCKNTLGQYFGLGSETRHTPTWVPDPYGIETGDPEKVPEGYDERWLLNVHAIDTRGAADKLGCTECQCALYNVTRDAHGRALPAGYNGGLYCCYDETRCWVREGFAGGEARKLFLRYTVKWVDWSESVKPVKIYIFDVTGSTESHCKVEYEVKECSAAAKRAKNGCIDIKASKAAIPRGGDLVYGVAHQHAGGIGASLHGQDGRLLCASVPTYGTGEEAGNEENYIVGMSTCYPKPGTVRVGDGEVLTVVSNYSSDRLHTGVMGLFYILVAEPQAPAKPSLCFGFPFSWCLPEWLSNNL